MNSPIPPRMIASWLAVGAGILLLSFAYLLKSTSLMAATTSPSAAVTPPTALSGNFETATLGAGCFWCVQAVLQRVDGIKEVTCGYMGGKVIKPTYEQVCTGQTGHAEVVRVKFDPTVISYEGLLDWFWRLHDPTTKDKQGADVGTQYRSAIFYYSDAQKAAAAKSLAEAQKHFAQPIVTEIVPALPFYPAEDYHQEYFNNHASAGYCRIIIAPKLDKLHLTQKPTTATDKK